MIELDGDTASGRAHIGLLRDGRSVLNYALFHAPTVVATIADAITHAATNTCDT